MLYRDAYYSKNPYDKTIEFIVDKNRIYGKVGTAKMLVNLETSRFLPIGGCDRICDKVIKTLKPAHKLILAD